MNFVIIFLQALWFFLPVVMANQCPGFAAKLNLPGNFPISKRFLGKNKTWAAYYAAAVGAIAVIYIQRECDGINHHLALFDYREQQVWLIGLLFGIGCVAGDHIKSFFKRLKGLPPGAKWWPFDQLDHVVGSIALTLPITGWIGWQRFGILALVVLSLHRGVNWLGWKVGLRKVPW